MLQFDAYLHYNAMAPFVGIAVLLALLTKDAKRHKKLIIGIVIIILVMNMVYYVYRMAHGYI